jgi:hypothetical protein
MAKLTEISDLLFAKPVLHNPRNLSAFGPISRERSVESQKALVNSSLLDRTFVAPIGGTVFPLTKARFSPYSAKPPEGGQIRSQPVSGQIISSKRIYGSQLKQ